MCIYIYIMYWYDLKEKLVGGTEAFVSLYAYRMRMSHLLLFQIEDCLDILLYSAGAR